jgi:Tol biopolymer transport system component
MDIYISNVVSMDTQAAEPTLLLQRGGSWTTVAWSPDDRYLLAKHYLSVSESYLYSVSIETGLVTPINEQSNKVSYGDACWSKDNKGSNFSRIPINQNRSVPDMRQWRRISTDSLLGYGEKLLHNRYKVKKFPEPGKLI